MHIVGYRAAGSPCSSVPIGILYACFGLAILFENAVQAFHLRLFRKSDTDKMMWAWKPVGYLWTLFFFSSNMRLAYENCDANASSK
ncbi:hypothetical protein M432DRAFT_14479 [Thermoascus aurantiacus ATCC 26904]